MKVFSGSLTLHSRLLDLYSDGSAARPEVEVVAVAASKADMINLGMAAGLGPGFCVSYLKLRTGPLPYPERLVFDAGILDRDAARVVLMPQGGEGPILDITGGQNPVEIGHFAMRRPGMERVAVYGPRR